MQAQDTAKAKKYISLSTQSQLLRTIGGNGKQGHTENE
jgi:hypothetical protein